jgi:outer membrane lipoprotein-sorting protein
MKTSAACFCAVLSVSGTSWANEAEDIATKAFENNSFTASNARADVDLEVSKSGKVHRKRRITTKIKKKDGVTRSFVEFREPADVAGTKFLSVEEGTGAAADAEQFIYLPAFKKVKRVVGSQRTESFMGTDFSYADLDGRDVDDAEWKRLADEKVGGQDCFVIEGVPKKPGDEDYGKSVLWVHKQYLVPMRIDFFDKDRTTVRKRFTVKKLERKSERWLATDAVMATLAKDTSTRIKITEVDFSSSIPDDEMTRGALER